MVKMIKQGWTKRFLFGIVGQVPEIDGLLWMLKHHMRPAFLGIYQK